MHNIHSYVCTVKYELKLPKVINMFRHNRHFIQGCHFSVSTDQKWDFESLATIECSSMYPNPNVDRPEYIAIHRFNFHA